MDPVQTPPERTGPTGPTGPAGPGKPPGLPGWARTLHRFGWGTVTAPSEGAGLWLNRAINVHKALTGPVVLALMLGFGVYTPAAWIYLALHGSYGLVWVIKDRALPDRQWQRRVSWWSGALVWVFLSAYWVAPVILVLGTAGVLRPGGGWSPAAPPVLAAAVVLYALGLVLMVGADAQKNVTLASRRAGETGGGDGNSGLITTGFYARTRHPNYLGEMMIYGAFALVVMHWLPWVILIGVWLFVFLPNMLAIDVSLSRYPEFAAWRDRTGFLLPRPGRRR